MRFGIPDDDEDDYQAELEIQFESYSSDESDQLPDFARRPQTKLGESIRDLLAFSDDELDSEDEVGDLLGGGYSTVVVDKISWRENTHNKGQGKPQQARPRPPRRHSSSWKRAPPKAGPSWGRWELPVKDLLKETPSEYNEWVKETEAEAWQEGHRVASERQARLRQMEDRVRAEMRAAQKGRRDTEADELQRMMEGLAVRQMKEEEDTAKRFAEREASLWADVDAAIKEAERQMAEEQATRAAEARKRKEEEEARIAAAEKEALARKQEQERQAKEKAEQEANDRAAREQAEVEAKAKEEAAKAEEEKRTAAAAESNRSVKEWKYWVQQQQRMKSEVIEVVKGNREERQSLRPAMRLITRGLGQVVNTKETIVRVTNDIHKLLAEQLPSPPSAAAPKVWDEPLPPKYGYIASHLSKALIKQAESEVSAKADAAFPLARIVLGLVLRGHAAFACILFARLVKKCPWVVPHYPARSSNQSREDYEKSTGRGSDESIAEYIARMAGITTLYFAILQTPLASIVSTLPQQPTPEQLPTLIIAPFRSPMAWTWLASILRAPLPGLPPSAHLISVCIDIVGSTLLQSVGPKQFGKLMGVIKSALDAGKIPGDSEAAKARLQLLLEDWHQSQTIKPPSGRIWD